MGHIVSVMTCLVDGASRIRGTVSHMTYRNRLAGSGTPHVSCSRMGNDPIGPTAQRFISLTLGQVLLA